MLEGPGTNWSLAFRPAIGHNRHGSEDVRDNASAKLAALLVACEKVMCFRVRGFYLVSC